MFSQWRTIIKHGNMTEEVKESTRDPCEINTFSALGSDVYTGQLIRRPDVLKGAVVFVANNIV